MIVASSIIACFFGGFAIAGLLIAPFATIWAAESLADSAAV